MAIDKATKIKIAFITIFFIATFTAEFFYRPPLFNNSISIAQKVQKKFGFSIGFLQYYTQIPKHEYAFILFVLYFFPISYSYTFFAELMLGQHICNIFKLSFGNGRPYLIDNLDARTINEACSSGYGNPSGHSFRATSTFLAFSQCIIDIWELGYLSSTFIYILAAILIFLINFSRVILGVHSIDQTIFGDTLGFCLFFIIFHIIKPHKREPKKFFENFLTLKYHVFNLIAFVVIFTYSLVLSIVFNREGEDEFEMMKENLKDLCPKAKDNTILTRDCIYKSLYFTAYFGMVLGITILTKIVKKRYYSRYDALNVYYKDTNIKWYFTYIIKLFTLGICYLPFRTIEYRPDGINLYMIYIVGGAIPLFIYGFMLFGPHYIFIIAVRAANSELYIPKLDDKSDKFNYKLDEENDDIVI
jgi:membrane-associated phospholipid phosphatase